MTPDKTGDVGKIRELSRGIEARVRIGSTAEHGTIELHVVSNSPRVREAVEQLRAALRVEAHSMLSAAQADSVKRGRTPIGLAPAPELSKDERERLAVFEALPAVDWLHERSTAAGAYCPASNDCERCAAVQQRERAVRQPTRRLEA